MDGLYRVTRDHLSALSVPGACCGGGGGGGRARAAAARLAFHFFAAVVYVVLHSLILFVQIVCLNVAINSRNNALFTLLISNNFMELKASVFKRFEAENLFQVACSDAVERFQLALFLFLIGVAELSTAAAARTLLPSMLAIFAAEVAVDYVKHAFVAKFNRLHSDLYATFAAILSHDVISVRGRMGASLDPTHSVVKRLGLATMPLAVVTVRMLLLRFWPDSGVGRSSSGGGGGGEGFEDGVEVVLAAGGGVVEGFAHAVGGAAGAGAAGAGAAAGAGELGAALAAIRALFSFEGVFELVSGGGARVAGAARSVVVGALIFSCLLALKTALGMCVLAAAARSVRAQKALVRAAAEVEAAAAAAAAAATPRSANSSYSSAAAPAAFAPGGSGAGALPVPAPAPAPSAARLGAPLVPASVPPLPLPPPLHPGGSASAHASPSYASSLASVGEEAEALSPRHPPPLSLRKASLSSVEGSSSDGEGGAAGHGGDALGEAPAAAGEGGQGAAADDDDAASVDSAATNYGDLPPVETRGRGGSVLLNRLAGTQRYDVRRGRVPL
jgi:hypothetical protein